MLVWNIFLSLTQDIYTHTRTYIDQSTKQNYMIHNFSPQYAITIFILNSVQTKSNRHDST